MDKSIGDYDTLVGNIIDSDLLLVQRGVSYFKVPASALGEKIFAKKVLLSNAQVLNSFTSPPEIIAAPGAGFAIQTIHASLKFGVGSVFATHITCGLCRSGNATSMFDAQETGESSLNGSSYWPVMTHQDSGANGNTLAENESLVFKTFAGNPTGGAGTTITVYVLYRIITL